MNLYKSLKEFYDDYEDDYEEDYSEPDYDEISDEPYERYIDDVLTMDYDDLVERYGKALADKKWQWFNKDGSNKIGHKIQYEMLCPECNNKFYLTTYSKKKSTDEAFSNVDPGCPNCKHKCSIDNIKSTVSRTTDEIDDDEIKESEEGNNNANNIIVKFEQSDRNNKTYFRALTLISQLENENYITKDEYDMYIDKLNKLYVEGRKANNS